jgi:hypothetical protein
MSSDLLLSFSEECDEKCKIGTKEDIRLHQDSTSVKHKAVKVDRCR